MGSVSGKFDKVAQESENFPNFVWALHLAVICAQEVPIGCKKFGQWDDWEKKSLKKLYTFATKLLYLWFVLRPSSENLKCKIRCRIHLLLKRKHFWGEEANIFSKKTATEVETVEINSWPRPPSPGAALLLSSPSLNTTTLLQLCKILRLFFQSELDSVGSTVHYEMMNLCTGSVKDTMRW